MIKASPRVQRFTSAALRELSPLRIGPVHVIRLDTQVVVPGKALIPRGALGIMTSTRKRKGFRIHSVIFPPDAAPAEPTPLGYIERDVLEGFLTIIGNTDLRDWRFGRPKLRLV